MQLLPGGQASARQLAGIDGSEYWNTRCVLLSRTELLRGLGTQELPASAVILVFILCQCLAVVILSVEEALLDQVLERALNPSTAESLTEREMEAAGP